MQSLLGSCMGVMVIKIWKTEHFNIVFQCFRALLLKGSEKNYLLKCRDGVRETLSHPCVFLDNSQGCTSSRQFWWVLQVLLHQFLPKEKGWGTEWLVWNCMNVSCGCLAYAMPETWKRPFLRFFLQFICQENPFLARCGSFGVSFHNPRIFAWHIERLFLIFCKTEFNICIYILGFS